MDELMVVVRLGRRRQKISSWKERQRSCAYVYRFCLPAKDVLSRKLFDLVHGTIFVVDWLNISLRLIYFSLMDIHIFPFQAICLDSVLSYPRTRLFRNIALLTLDFHDTRQPRDARVNRFLLRDSSSARPRTRTVCRVPSCYTLAGTRGPRDRLPVCSPSLHGKYARGVPQGASYSRFQSRKIFNSVSPTPLFFLQPLSTTIVFVFYFDFLSSVSRLSSP